VDLSGAGIDTPLLLRKADGATLYATRDLAAARYRQATYQFDRCLYVTDQGQALHFRQLFATLTRLGHAWAAGMQHVPFGVLLMWDEAAAEWTRGKSRSGRVVLLEEVLDEAARRVQAVIAEKNPDLANAAAVAEQVGVGAVIFNDLKNRREKDVHFRFEDALNFEGDAGPYVQNAHVRACGILRKSGGAYEPSAAPNGLVAPEERLLLLEIARFPEATRRAALDLEPHPIAGALLRVSAALHRFYHHHRVLDAETPALRAARLRLVDAARRTLHNGLHLLGIAAPEEM
jgi:arginyl-tRNA synthetase